MAFDDYEDEDPYRKKVLDDLTPNTGIAGPNPAAPAAPAAAPKGAFDLEGIRGRLGFGKADLSNAQGWLNANQDVAFGATIRDDKMYDPSGRYMADVISNYKTGGRTSQFLDGIGSNGKPRTPALNPSPGVAKPDGGLKRADSHPGGEFGPTGPMVPTSPAAPGAPAAPSAANDFLTQIRKMILERLGSLNAQGDPSNSPEVRQPLDAATRAAERVRRQRQDSAAERLSADGVGDSGALDAEIGRSYEDLSSDVSGVSSQLVSRAVEARRAEVQNLMNMALQSGDAESARALQAQLAQLDAQLRREALKESGRQFNLTDKYRYKALDEQGRQWDDQFGWQQNRGYNDDYWRRIMLGLG